jgi:hypothetical protein
MVRRILGTLAVMAILGTAAPAKADIAISGWLRTGYAEQAQGFAVGLGAHLGVEFWDVLMIGLLTRFNAVPDGLRGPHSAGDLGVVGRIRLPVGEVLYPYAAIQLGMGIVTMEEMRHDVLAGTVGGELGFMFRLTDVLLLRFGVEAQSYIGDLRDRNIAFTGNGVIGLDWHL